MWDQFAVKPPMLLMACAIMLVGIVMYYFIEEGKLTITTPGLFDLGVMMIYITSWNFVDSRKSNLEREILKVEFYMDYVGTFYQHFQQFIIITTLIQGVYRGFVLDDILFILATGFCSVHIGGGGGKFWERFKVNSNMRTVTKPTGA